MTYPTEQQLAQMTEAQFEAERERVFLRGVNYTAHAEALALGVKDYRCPDPGCALDPVP